MVGSELGVPFMAQRSGKQDHVIPVIIDTPQECDRLFFFLMRFHTQTAAYLFVITTLDIVIQESVRWEIAVGSREPFVIELLERITAHDLEVMHVVDLEGVVAQPFQRPIGPSLLFQESITVIASVDTIPVCFELVLGLFLVVSLTT